MKIFNRSFVPPILIHKTSTIFGDDPDVTIFFRKSKMGGTMRTTSWTLVLKTKTKNFQRSFVWRPDVTRYWWNDSKQRRNNNRGGK